MARNKAAGHEKVARDGFAAIDDYYGRRTRQQPEYGRKRGVETGERRKPQPQYGYPCQQQPYTNRRNSGYIIYSSVPPAKESVLDCDEAAKQYGGVLFNETEALKQYRWKPGVETGQRQKPQLQYGNRPQHQPYMNRWNFFNDNSVSPPI